MKSRPGVSERDGRTCAAERATILQHSSLRYDRICTDVNHFESVPKQYYCWKSFRVPKFYALRRNYTQYDVSVGRWDSEIRIRVVINAFNHFIENDKYLVVRK